MNKPIFLKLDEFNDKKVSVHAADNIFYIGNAYSNQITDRYRQIYFDVEFEHDGITAHEYFIWEDEERYKHHVKIKPLTRKEALDVYLNKGIRGKIKDYLGSLTLPLSSSSHV